MKLSQLKPNPKNPRTIKDERFKKLVKSLQEFPEMMAKRPMVCVTDVDGKLFPLGGNMRLKALQEIGMKDIPDEWVMLADDWTEEKRQEFVIKDNVGFGDWDWNELQSDWDLEQLEDWGLEVPVFMEEPSGDDLIGEEKNKPATMKITFESPEQLQSAEKDIQELIDRKYKGAYFSVSAGEI
jgi:ParB-like chromosome segregation protein Spo0J